MIKPHQILIAAGFTISVIAYRPFISDDMHYLLMASSFCIFLWAMHRMRDEPLTRLLINVTQAAAVQNLYDEITAQNTETSYYEYLIFGIITTISIILFIRKQPRYVIWRKNLQK